MAATGTYINRGNIEAIFGKQNIRSWADLDNDAKQNEARVKTAIDTAERRVENRFRNGPYAVPITSTGGTLFEVIDWCAKLAGIWLYRNRGADDTANAEEENTRYSDMEASVFDEIGAVLAGAEQPPFAPVDDSTPTAPVAVKMA